jgi:hypothetical protein
MRKLKTVIKLGVLFSVIIGLLFSTGLGCSETVRTRGNIGLMIDSVYPRNDMTDVPLNSSITITLNMPVNQSLFPQAFSISPYITGEFSWSDDSKTVAFTPIYNFSDYTIYSVNLDKAYVISQDGKFQLEDNYTWSFEAGHPHKEPYILTLGPVVDTDGKVVVGALVTITIFGIEYSNLSDLTGYVHFTIPDQPASGEYKVLISKEGYDILEFLMYINDSPPPPPPPLEKPEKPKSFIPIFEIVICFSALLLILGYNYRTHK